jgi:hypothetical protein
MVADRHGVEQGPALRRLPEETAAELVASMILPAGADEPDAVPG